MIHADIGEEERLNGKRNDYGTGNYRTAGKVRRENRMQLRKMQERMHEGTVHRDPMGHT